MKTKIRHSNNKRVHFYGLCITALTLLLTTGAATAQSPVFGPAVNIDQNDLLAKKYPLQKVLESGGQFWTTPYTVADGVGEGDKGPRAKQRAAMYPNNPTFPFLRVNGIDSQSCYECHNSIGSYVPADSSTGALIRKPTPVGGSAGFNSDAFINPEFPTPLTLFVRNPPHVFGTGYVQQLGFEMTSDLLGAVKKARDMAVAKPGFKQSTPLQTKGINFGSYSVTYDADSKICKEDFTQVVGVSNDFVVRPLQWKGIASSIRHFVKDALDFHFSMQAEEKVGTDAKGKPKDCDKDGVVQEVTVGNVTAITAFVGLTRPPTQTIPAGQEKQVALGKDLFSGKSSPRIPKGSQMCATCHTPSLHLNKAILSIETPKIPVGEDCPQEVIVAADSTTTTRAKIPSLTDPVADSSMLAAHKIFDKLNAKTAPTQLSTDTDQPSFDVDLTNPKLESPTSYALPRLPHNPDNSVDVPLFSDLKRHNMGKGLSDPCFPEQGTDVAGISVPARLYLTRPLWGVSDTGPWLHDGRARSLLEAIQLHSSEGSEANDVIAAFNALQQEEKDAIISFLLTLHLPLQQGQTPGK
jgi:Di-haem oxidoreductase, putative peroxidase